MSHFLISLIFSWAALYAGHRLLDHIPPAPKIYRGKVDSIILGVLDFSVMLIFAWPQGLYFVLICLKNNMDKRENRNSYL